MGLYKETIKSIFGFWKENLGKLLLYQLLFFPLLLAGYLCIYTFTSSFLYSFSLFLVGLALVGFLIIVAFSLIQGGGYSLLVKQTEKERKINIIKAFKESSKKIHKIFATSFVVGLPVLILIVLLGALAYNYIINIYTNTLSDIESAYNFNNTEFFPDYQAMSISGAASAVTSNTWLISLLVAIIVLLPIALYFPIRLLFSIPILMIEEKGIKESLKTSWKLTKGKVWTLMGITFTITMITGIIVNILGYLPYGSYIKDIVNYMLFAPLVGIISTIAYYTIKSRE